MRQPSIALITFIWARLVAAVGLTPSGTVVAEDVRDLQSRTGHDAPATAGGFSVLWPGGVSRSSGLVTARSTLVATCV